ncbi:ABC transporter substrate-binding protein [Corynebacterium uterequi]|uniref:ABC-type hemin transport system, periplasmic component n=1 Tax=Corynebacterium uterequi TaxID=1072256 RepID=A0A0G3HEG2_9CORY|nr:ABC transporter substrate-binding protein [Corynebacterium uterequi]AKK11669.1 ABC-type hemin transport system, periplasmic component [Corynebacterium uterequi]
MIHRRRVTAIATLACVALLTACNPATSDSENTTSGASSSAEATNAAAEPITFTGDDGAEITVDNPQKIFALEDSVIEIADALGVADRIAFIPKSSDVPELAPKAEGVNTAGKGSLTVEGVIALNPDLVVATNRRHEEIVKGLQAAGIPATLIDRDQHPADIVANVATVFGVKSDGEAMAKDIRASFDRISAAVADVPEADRQRVLVVSTSGAGGNISGGGTQTPADFIIKAAGGINAGAEAGIKRFSALTPEGVAAAQPDLIVVADTELEGLGGEEGIWEKVPGLAATPAAASKSLLVLPNSAIRIGGLSAVDGAAALAETMYPDAF